MKYLPQTMMALCVLGWSAVALGQAECSAWGAMRGIRVDGELMAFTTGVRAFSKDTPIAGQPGGERLANPRYWHQGNVQSSAGSLFYVLAGERGRGGGAGEGRQSLRCGVVTEDTAPGTVTITVQATAGGNDADLGGIYFFVHLPGADYSGASAQVIDASKSSRSRASLAATQPASKNNYLSGAGRGLRVAGAHQTLEVLFDSPRQIVIQDDRTRGNTSVDVCIPIQAGKLTARQTVQAAFTIKASGDVDKTPVAVSIDPSRPGSVFDGIGGNFRLQSRLDGPQIRYNLEHLRVPWGRVAMPLNAWQPDEMADPFESADAGKINPGVRGAMEMAGTLAKKNIPIIASVWSAPAWMLAPPEQTQGPPVRGRRIRPEKWGLVCKSIGSYLQYMKQKYAAEPRLFSFNESDLGIYVLQSPQEHAEAIKRLGAYFESQKLATKVLLGDTGNPRGIDFIDAALSDSNAAKYIGAVSFHSWHGGTIEQYQRWDDAARKLHVPLLVAEGGTDPGSYAYPGIFAEPWYALEEISQYVEICRICQPLSILQWQLTENYSLLSGGRNGAPFAPTQRFWQLKQLGSTPVRSAAIPVTCDKPNVVACAFVHRESGVYSIHLVNNGPTREVVVAGLPQTVKRLSVLSTDARRGMNEANAAVNGGRARMTIDTQSYLTLISAAN
jgi:O-glycosyl hydrolase